MNRVQIGLSGRAEAGGRTPRRTGKLAPPDRLAFSRNAVRPGADLPKTPPLKLQAVGYVRVSTDEQGDSGLGLADQRRSIELEASRRGWHLTTIRQDVASGSRTLNRPALAECLDDLEAGRAAVLVVAKLDRLTRSSLDFAAILDRFNRKGWGLDALDLGMDTSTPTGEAMATVVAAFAQLERRRIGERTKGALAALRQKGVKLGRPRTRGPEVERAVRRGRTQGLSLSELAVKYGLPRSTVQAILSRLNS